MLIVATLAIGWWTHVMFCNQFPSFLYLVFNLIAHGSDFIDRPEVLLGISMAVQAPAHAQRFFLENNIHSIYAAVA